MEDGRLVAMTASEEDAPVLFVQPDIRRKRVRVAVDAPANATARLRIEGTPFEAEGPAAQFSIEFPEFDLWSPREPALYSLECLLSGESCPSEPIRVRFGMREFGVKEGRFYLNNHPLYVRAAQHTAEEIGPDELGIAKGAGLDMLRLGGPCLTPELLGAADELGLLVYAEPWADGPAQRDVKEIQPLLNHPSVVIWGVPGEGSPAKKGIPPSENRLALSVRDRDPSRLILIAASDAQGHIAPARLLRPYRKESEPYDELRFHHRAPIDAVTLSYLANVGEPDALNFVSSFGFGGSDPGAMGSALMGFEARQLDRVFGGTADVAEAMQELQATAAGIQLDALRSNGKIAGYCYARLLDTPDAPGTGLLDPERNPRPVCGRLKEINAPLRPLIAMAQSNLVPRQEAPVTIMLANDRRLEGRVDISLQVVGPTNQVLWKKKRNIKIPRHGKELWTGSISASGSIGPHRFVARLMQGSERIAESSVAFHVLPEPKRVDAPVHVLDPAGTWETRCAAIVRTENFSAPLHVIPPLANTIRAYPDNGLAQVLGRVYEGAVALVLSPPDDWNDLADLIDPSLRTTNAPAIGGMIGTGHYTKLHPLFDNLPAKGLMGQAYRNVVPVKTIGEISEEDIAGTFSVAGGLPDSDGAEGHWGSDIVVRRYGSGRLVFMHLRLLEHLETDPVAQHLFANSLRHFARRSVPSNAGFPVHQKAVEWLRTERNEHTRRWMVMGMFPNWNGKGHGHAYPPENEIDLKATYPGWYRSLQWKAWHSTEEQEHCLDLQEALAPVFVEDSATVTDCGVAYAYAEFGADRRAAIRATLRSPNPCKVWINNRLVHENAQSSGYGRLAGQELEGSVRQGKNHILAKFAKGHGPGGFSLSFETTDEPLHFVWWR